MTTITTVSGDTWDRLAKRAYGNERLMSVLIAANMEHRKTSIFRAGVVLTVPDVPKAAAEPENLPPWRR